MNTASASVASRSALPWLWLSLAVLVLDFGSKALAQALMIPGVEHPLLPSFSLTLVYNTGAAWSFLSEAGGWQRWFFVILSTGVSLVILVWLKRLSAGERHTAFSLALILGGAVGNLIDRARFGHVIDFIHLYYGSFHWPVFNVADSAITVGAVALALASLRRHPGQD